MNRIDGAPQLPTGAAGLAAIAEERERRVQLRATQRAYEHADEIRAKSLKLRGFIEEAWPILEPSRPLKTGWAINAMCDLLERVTHGQIQYLLMNVPPGMMKSLMLVFWTVWEWGPCNRPDYSYLATSYSKENLDRDADKIRKLVKSEWFSALWPEVAIRQNRDAIGYFQLTRGGTYDSRPFASMTGGRADRTKIDDPHSVDGAESDVKRNATIRTFREGISDRLNDLTKSVMVVIMQRVHQADVSGLLIELNIGFVHLCLPMEYDPARHCRIVIDGKVIFNDPRKVEGELLFPERFPREELNRLRILKGEYAWCNPAEAPILMGDLSMKPLGEIKIGDKVTGFTTDTKPRREGELYSRRHLIESEVTNISRSRRAVVRMYLDSGREIRCTADHRWYNGRTERGNYAPAEVGTPLFRVCDPELQPIKTMEETHLLGWLAGFFDADGSVSMMKKTDNRPSALIQFTQGDGRNLALCEKLERVLKYFGFEFSYKAFNRDPKHSHCIRQYYLRGRGISNSQRFLHLVKVAKWRDRLIEGAMISGFITGKERVLAIEPDGVEDVYGLTTTTGNYVVWGLASANSAQYDQLPTPRSGGFFNPDQIEIVDHPPVDIVQWIRAWDMAASTNGDWTVGILVGRRRDNRLFIADIRRERFNPDARDKMIVDTAKLDGKTVMISLPKDPSAAGKAQAVYHVRMLMGYNVEASPEKGAKDIRAEAAASQLNVGAFSMMRASWNRAFADELRNFPNGRHDDQVDALSRAFDKLIIGVEQNWIVSPVAVKGQRPSPDRNY